MTIDAAITTGKLTKNVAVDGVQVAAKGGAEMVNIGTDVVTGTSHLGSDVVMSTAQVGSLVAKVSYYY